MKRTMTETPDPSRMTRRPLFIRSLALAGFMTFATLSLNGLAVAQDRGQDNSPGFLDNLFNRGEGRRDQQQGQQDQSGRPGTVAQGEADPSDLAVRLDRLENALRQLTGKVEQLQYRNQQLEMRLNGAQGAPGQATTPGLPSGPGAPSAPAAPGRRSDVFVPSQHPEAPGAPRTLGSASVPAGAPQFDQRDDQPVGAPGGRDAGGPLDLSTLSANQPRVPAAGASAAPVSAANPMTAAPMPAVRNVGTAPAAPATRLATLPPSASPQDEYDLAYGYVLHKDYALAEQAFRDFIKKYPNERLQPDAQYWLGESLYQRQRYRDAAESFLAVSTKYEHAGKAPDSLLRLGQSLAAMKQKEAACATLSEVSRKYPKASSAVKRGVSAEIKRAHC